MTHPNTPTPSGPTDADRRRRPASEEEFLALVDAAFPGGHAHMLLGRGDDCAVLRCPERLVLTTDLFLEDVHFRRAYFTPAEIGHKALAVNLSDLAAMGSRPLGFSLALAAPADMDTDCLKGLLRGMAALAERFDTALTGGDVSRGPVLCLSITAWGEPGDAVLRRGRAEPGDLLFAVGPLGLARVGLLALEATGREALADHPAACAAHLSPEPLVNEGLALARLAGQGIAIRGAMDVSDGLATDLPRFLAGSGARGADLDPEPGWLHPEVEHFCKRAGADPAAFALAGGEDYALLGAAAPEAMDAVRAALPGALVLGRATAEPGLRLHGRPLAATGFDHFNPTGEAPA